MDGRARRCRIDELAGDNNQVVEGQIQRAPEFDDNRPLGLAERGMQPMLGVRAIRDALPGDLTHRLGGALNLDPTGQCSRPGPASLVDGS